MRRLEVCEHELRLVVQHLFKVRHAPRAVDRVAVKPAADVVAHATERHCTEVPQDHLACVAIAGPGMLAEEKQQLGRPWKFRRIAEAAVPRIERLLELPHRGRKRIACRHGPHGRRLLE